jgi:hypothetical protein
MSEYKLAITAAAKYVYGENTSEISFTQLKSLITRLYGEECDGGKSSVMNGGDIERIIVSLVGKDSKEAGYFVDSPEVKEDGRLSWKYDINTGQATIYAK